MAVRYRPGLYSKRARLTAVQVMEVAINSGASLMAEVPNNRGGKDSSAVVAVATAYAENAGFRPRITRRNSNGSTDTGLWMINSVHLKSHPDWTVKNLQDPDANARAAAALSGTFRTMSPSVWLAIDTTRYDRGLKIARTAQAQLVKGFDASDLGVVQDITNVRGAVEFGGDVISDVASNAFTGLAKALWPVLMSTALAGTGLALIGYGVVRLFGGGQPVRETVRQAGSLAAAGKGAAI